MAGGKGERFWPRSRESRPKQLQKVYSGKTLLEETILRARAITDSKSIYIGCNPALKKAILKTHRFPAANFIIEPEGRNTAPIVALAALQLEKKHPSRIHVVLSADHFITPLKEFQKTIGEALRAAADGWLVTLGVKPSRPETGYGYIAVGPRMKGSLAHPIQSFVEKPDAPRALEYIQKKNFFWNSGIFVWKGGVILEEFERHAPQILHPLRDSFSGAAALKRSFARIPKEPIDTAIMERSDRIAMIPASFTWDDVGSWLSLERIVPADGDGNVLVANEGRAQLVAHQAGRNIVMSSRKLVALVGIDDVIVVEDGDVLFISGRKGIGEIKELTARLRKNQTLQKFLH